MTQQGSDWKNWGDHPFVVVIATVAGLIAIVTFSTGGSNLSSILLMLKGSPSPTVSPSPTGVTQANNISHSIPSLRSAMMTGTWESPVYGILRLKQNGDTFAGGYEYSHKLGHRFGQMKGEFINNSFVFHWWEDPKRAVSYEDAELHGEGYFVLSQDGNTLEGKWRREGKSEWETTWVYKRTR